MSRRDQIFAARLAELLEEFADIASSAQSLALFGAICSMLGKFKGDTPSLADVAAFTAKMTQRLAGEGLVTVPAEPVERAPAPAPRKRAKK